MVLANKIRSYIQTADKLMRTARWLESFEGGVEVSCSRSTGRQRLTLGQQRLRRIIIDDELGICADLDASMQQLVAGFEDEWARVVNEPERRKAFRKFANAVSPFLPCQLSF